ncbi:hypothetical protein [Cognatishimia sp.]
MPNQHLRVRWRHTASSNIFEFLALAAEANDLLAPFTDQIAEY